MTEENNKELWQSAQDPDGEAAVPVPAEEPEETDVLPQEDLYDEPEEIVSWYMSPEEDDAPADGDVKSKFDDLYVTGPRQSVEVWHQAARREKKRRRVIRIIVAACLLVAAGVTTALLWPGKSSAHGREEGQVKPESGDSASSIVDVTGSDKTTIPRYTGKSTVRLEVNPQRGEELSAVEIYQKVNPSVVTVVAETMGSASIGTGVIMTPDGYIITNAHVISGGQSCWVALDNGVSMDALLVGYDEEEDLAVLKAVDAARLPAAEFGDSENLLVGERAYAIGNPLGIELRGTLTDGIISAVNRQLEVGDGYMTMIQTTAALNNGNSGGPLINSSGQIVGINTLKMSGTGWRSEATVEGLGFALPISSVCFVVNDIIAYGEFRGVPTIGITVITTQDGEGGTQVEVHSVAEGMGAAEAGIQEGDIIVAADGAPVHQVGDLQAVRRSHNVGDTVTLTLLRDGRTMDVDVVLYSNKGK